MSKAKQPKYGLPRRRAPVTAEQTLDLCRGTLNAVTALHNDLRVAIAAKPGSLDELVAKVRELDDRLREAVERKPSRVLYAIVYRLRSVTTELADVYQQMERNNSLVEALCRCLNASVPVLQPMTADEVEAMITKRLAAAKLSEAGGR